MADRLKILDCNRKAVLSLPSPALHLWLCYYMNEDEEQESWMSIPEIKAQTGLSRHSIVDWTDYLVRTNWLADTGKTAADKWIARGKTPTRGAYQIHVYSVDDPTSAKSALVNSSVNMGNRVTSANPALVQNLHQCAVCTQGLGSVGLGLDSLGLRSVGVSYSSTQAGPPTPIDQEDKPENLNPNPPASGVGTKKHEGKTCWTHGLPLPCQECYQSRGLSNRPVSVPNNPDDLDAEQCDLEDICSYCSRVIADTTTKPCFMCEPS